MMMTEECPPSTQAKSRLGIGREKGGRVREMHGILGQRTAGKHKKATE